MRRMQARERGQIEMVVVVVRQEDRIDGRQIGECDAGGGDAFWPGKGEGAGAV